MNHRHTWVPDSVDSAELFDVYVDELTRMLAFVTAHRLCRLKGFEVVQAQASQDTRDGCPRKACLLGDPCSGEALTAQDLDALDQ